MAQFSNHLKILPTKPTTKIQEAKLVERPRYVRRSVRKREVGVAQASQPHFITVQDFSRFSSFFHVFQDFSRFPTFFAFFEYFHVFQNVLVFSRFFAFFRFFSRFSRFIDFFKFFPFFKIFRLFQDLKSSKIYRPFQDLSSFQDLSKRKKN